jgi:hypothetical protein
VADGVEFKPDHIENFSAEMHGKSLTYNFSVTLPKPAKKISLAIWDEEFYVDLDPPVKEDDSKGGSALSARHYTVQPYIKPFAEKGAPPAACDFKPEKRVNKVWGDFITYITECEAK